MDRRNTVLPYIAYGLEILIFFIVQGVPNLIPDFFGGKPLLLLPVVITIAGFESEIPAMAFGIAGGAMLDFGTQSHIGFYTISLAIVCFFIGYFSRNYLNIRLVVILLISLVVIPVLISFKFFITHIIAGYENNLYYYVHHTLGTMGITFLTTPIFYGINRTISRGFNDYI